MRKTFEIITTIVLLITIVCAFVFVLSKIKADFPENKEVKNSRIQIEQRFCKYGDCYQIISVDGKEYLSNQSGGLIELEKNGVYEKQRLQRCKDQQRN